MAQTRFLGVTGLVFVAEARLTRLSRRKCPECGYQRVLYRLRQALVPYSESREELLPLVSDDQTACARCWGIR